jgi:Tfp pilus assembly protein PilO
MVNNLLSLIKNNRYLPYGLSAVLILLLILTGLLLNQQKMELVSKRIAIGELNRDLNLLDKILADKKTYQEKIKTAFQSIPSSYEEVSLAVYRFEYLANKNQQVLETTIDQVTKKETNGLNSLGITFKSSGSYNDFSNMISDFSNLPYFITIDSLRIEKPINGLSAMVNLRLFTGEIQ